jgi:hypothetical protein
MTVFPEPIIPQRYPFMESGGRVAEGLGSRRAGEPGCTGEFISPLPLGPPAPLAQTRAASRAALIRGGKL